MLIWNGIGVNFFFWCFSLFNFKWPPRKFEIRKTSNIYVVQIYDNKEHFHKFLSHIIDLCAPGTRKSDFHPSKKASKIATFLTPPPPATRIIGFLEMKLVQIHALMHRKSFLSFTTKSISCVCHIVGMVCLKSYYYPKLSRIHLITSWNF